MIAPADRLLWVFAVVALPAGFFPLPIASVIWGVLALVATADAAVAARRMGRLNLASPALLRLTRARAGTLAVQISNSGAPAADVRVGLRFPEEIGCETNEVTIGMPAPGEKREVHFECKPRRRGTVFVRTAALSVQSPLRFWHARKRVSPQIEVRIYPDLLTGQEAVAPLLLRRQAGLHVQRQVGRGREFEKVRDYLPGDPMSDIHWKASARRAHPVTRVYQIERTQEIYAVIDCSRLTARPAGDDTVLERYVSAALALIMATRQQGDLVGLVAFSDAVHAFLRAGAGPAHYDACRNTLLAVTPRQGTPDYAEVFAAIQSRLRRRAMLVFLTELDDPVLAEDFQQGIREVARHHLVAVASIRPASAAPVFEQDAAALDEVYERLAGHFSWRTFEDIGAKLRSVGVRFTAVRGPRLGLEVARTYLNVKKQQTL